MTVCNMSIEGGARCGYVNPDADHRSPTCAAARSRRRARPWSAPSPGGERIASRRRRAATTTWCVSTAPRSRRRSPGASTPARRSASASAFPRLERRRRRRARRWSRTPTRYMDLKAGRADRGHEDRCRLHRLVHQRPHLRPARGGARRRSAARSRRTSRRSSCRARRPSREQAEAEGLHEVFRAAGFEWREPGCSMCLAMNPDKLRAAQVCASSSNRNFKGRQGSPTGPHAADEPGDGRRGGDRGRRHRRARAMLLEVRA